MQDEFNLVEGFHTENSVNLGGVLIAGMFAEVGKSPTPTEVRQESARDTTVPTNIRKTHSAYDKFQRDAKSVIAKSMECSTTQGCTVERDLKTAFVKGKKLDQELMSLETLALKSDPLSDDNVLRAASTASDLAELVKDACALASALRNFVQAQDEHAGVASHSRAATTRILKFRMSDF